MRIAEHTTMGKAQITHILCPQTVNIETTYTPCSNNEDSCKANAHGNSHKEAVWQGRNYWYESLDKVKFL